jgi:hypothetical protein
MQGPRTMSTAHRVIQHRSGTHDTEGPIAGISENESGNDIDRHCFLIEDLLIRSDCLKHFSSFLIRFATLPCSRLSRFHRRVLRIVIRSGAKATLR